MMKGGPRLNGNIMEWNVSVWFYEDFAWCTIPNKDSALFRKNTAMQSGSDGCEIKHAAGISRVCSAVPVDHIFPFYSSLFEQDLGQILHTETGTCARPGSLFLIWAACASKVRWRRRKGEVSDTGHALTKYLCHTDKTKRKNAVQLCVCVCVCIYR